MPRKQKPTVMQTHKNNLHAKVVKLSKQKPKNKIIAATAANDNISTA